MLATISIETQSPDGQGPVWFTMAAWVAGTVMVVLVIFLVIGMIRIAKGKAISNSQSTSKGITTVALSLGGAVILGTSAGAIAWSAQDSNYNLLGSGGDGAGTAGLSNLMPAGARPAQVEVPRTGPLVNCEDTASIAAGRHGQTWGSMHPTASEHETMEAMLEDNGVLDALKDQIIDDDVMLDPNGAGMGWDTEEHFDQAWGSDDFGARLSRVEWIPADSADGCDTSNRTATSGTEMIIGVWGGDGTSWYSSQQISERTVTVP